MALFCPLCKCEVETWRHEYVCENGKTEIVRNCGKCGKLIDWLQMAYEPKTFVFPFGKHKGKTLEEILLLDKRYLEWVSKEFNDNRIKLRAIMVLGGS